MDANVVAAEGRGQLPPGGLEGEVRAVVERGAETLRPELLGEVAHPGQPPVLAIPQLAEDLGDATAELDCLVGPDEHVDIGRHALAVGEAAANEHVEAHGAIRLLGGPQTDVVDLHPGAVLGAARDGDLELAGQVRVLAIAREERRDRLSDGERVDDLFLVDARHRARAHVAGRVAAGLHGRQPDLPEALPDPGHVGDADPVQLNVLARREVGVAVPEDRAVLGPFGERVGRHTDLADLGGGHDPSGHLDPHHEGVAALALRVHPDPFQALLLAGHLGDGFGALLGVRVDDRLSNLERVPRELQLLDGIELADVPVRPDELEAAVPPAPELHPIGVIEVTWH